MKTAIPEAPPIRVIARLDIKGPNLVKGVHLEGLRVMGKPHRFAQHYYEEGADELIYMDAVASLYGRNSLTEFVERTARNLFIPLTVGGGLRTIEDIRTVLLAGADKVSINTAAIRRPELIAEASRTFGSSTIVISIEAKARSDGSYEAYTDNGRERTGVDVFEWAVRAAELGAGEILLTSIDREGTGKGFDLALTRTVAESVSIPVIASGGAGTLDDLYDVVTKGAADAVSVSSMLHYRYVSEHQSSDDYSDEGNVEYLRGGRESFTGKGATLPEIKQFLRRRKIPCRLDQPELVS